MLANNMLLPEVKPAPESPKNLGVRANDSGNRGSSSNQQKDDFNQVMQRSRSEQLKQEQIKQEQTQQKHQSSQRASQERRAEIDKQADLQQAKKLDSQKQQAQRAEGDRLDARNNEQRRLEERKQADSKVSNASKETKPDEAHTLNRSEPTTNEETKNKADGESETGQEQTEKSSAITDGTEKTNEHDCECDKELSEMAKHILAVDVKKDAKEAGDDAKEIDTRWLDTVIDIVSGGQKGEGDSKQESEANKADLSDSLNGEEDKQSKSLEQLLAELKNKSNQKNDAIKSDLDNEAVDNTSADKADVELAKQAELAVLKAMENKLAQQAANNEKQNSELTAESSSDESKITENKESKLVSLSQLLQQEQESSKVQSEAPKPDKTQLEQAQSNAATEGHNSKTAEQGASLLTSNVLAENKGTDKAVTFDKSQLLNLELNQKRQIQQQNLAAQQALTTESKTKVIDLGGAPTLNVAANKLFKGDSELDAKNNKSFGLNASNFGDELSKDMRANADSTETSTKSVEQKLADTLSANLFDTGINKANLNDVKPEKVEVAGVMVDKTLQMPKLENIANVKNDVIIRENILFNKQELANHMQQQIGIMMAKNMKSLDMRMDPPDLGAMQVRLAINNDQASVSFVVSNQQTKDALEASIPKLREMLEQQGVELAESNVQQDNGQQQKGMSDGESNGEQSLDANGEEISEELLDADRNRASANSPWNVSYYA